jgi:uncharacterized protein affecting Mg2+/Co2+ transport
MATRIQLRRDTAANWTLNDPTLASGELGFETDTLKLKCGNGTTAWSSLSYVNQVQAGAFTLADNTNIVLGDGSDLQIYHDGTASVITETQGNTLYVRGDQVIIGSPNNETGIQFNKDGDVKLYHDDSQKFATTSTGVYATGVVQATGNIIAGGEFQALSDARLKTKVETIGGALDKVKAMRGVSFTMEGKPSVGVIAQEMLEVVPEVVNTTGDYYKVAYANLVGVLIEAIKELSAKVDQLEVSNNDS